MNKKDYVILTICLIVGISIMAYRFPIIQGHEPGSDLAYDIGFLLMFPPVVLIAINLGWDWPFKNERPSRHQVE